MGYHISQSKHMSGSQSELSPLVWGPCCCTCN